jgi:AraC-like DNA-binding protein
MKGACRYWTKLPFKRIARRSVQSCVRRGESTQDTRFRVAKDVGGIELLHANFRKFEVQNHTHEGYSISVTLQGGLEFDHRGSTHRAPSGVISAVEPGAIHNARGLSEEWSFVNFLVPVEIARSAVRDISERGTLPGFAQRVIVDREMTRRLLQLHRRLENSKDTLARQSDVVLTLATFFRRHSSASGRVSRETTVRAPVDRARELLHASYADRVSLQQLSACAGLSPFHFLRVFEQAVGFTPHAYLNQIRVREAQRRLSLGTPSAQVALDCGFCDQSHMVRAFRRVTGVTPGQYQNAHVEQVAIGCPEYTAARESNPHRMNRADSRAAARNNTP